MKREDYYVDYGMDVLSINDRIDKIFYDVESRTCENCKYYEESFSDIFNGICKNTYGNVSSIIDEKDFGCNKFERITND